MASGAEILMFDEPVLGLDANHRDMFYKELMESYIEKPKTIIISTHLIEEVAQLLERVVIIVDGKIIKDESVEELLKGCYCVSGLNKNIDTYIEDKHCISVDEMAAFKSVVIIGENGECGKDTTEKIRFRSFKVLSFKNYLFI